MAEDSPREPNMDLVPAGSGAPDMTSDPDDAPPPPEPSRHNGSQSRSKSRNRPASARHPRRRYSAEYEFPSTASMRSSRPLRYRDEWDDDYDRDRDYRSHDRYWRDEPRHPDYFERRQSRMPPRTRPPRSHLNHPSQWDEPESPPKHYVNETSAPYSPRRYAEDEEWGDGAITSGQIDFRNMTAQQRAEVLRIPWTQWMNSSFKNHFVATMGEFIGTSMFLLFAFAGTEVANIQSRANNSNGSDSGTTTGGATGFNVGVLLYISLIFGFSLMVNVWIFFRISGGLFNPAVTLAMVLVKAISPARAICLFIAQIGGSLLASVIVRFLFPESFNVRTTLGGGATIVQGVFIEAILTAELVFTIFMLAKEKHRATFIAPVGIGLALFISEMVGVQFTGGSLNPARSFGPCAVTATFDPEHWIYWVGPLIGSLIAVVFYRFIKTLEYEMANPGADGDPENDPTQNPEKKAEIRSSRRMSSSEPRPGPY